MPDAKEPPQHPIRSLGWLDTPDPVLVEFGSGGPGFLLRLRVGFFVCLLALAAGLHVFQNVPGLAGATAMAAAGLATAVFLARRAVSHRASSPIAFITAGLDPALVSAILILFALQGRPDITVNSMFVWELYLVAIFASALHFDPRVCVFSGLMSATQFSAVFVWAVSSFGIPMKPYDNLRDFYLIQGLRFVLMAIATFLAAMVAVRSSRLIRMSGTDALTGLANRALFDQRLVAEVKMAQRMRRTLCVVFLDIDEFKRFNDRWGHRAGDDALRITARVLQEACRESDVIARWGGEEFVIVLPETSRADAGIVIERIRKRLDHTALSRTDGLSRVALSGGLAVLPDDGEDAVELVAAADQRLLRAKRLGRNRIVSEG